MIHSPAALPRGSVMTFHSRFNSSRFFLSFALALVLCTSAGCGSVGSGDPPPPGGTMITGLVADYETKHPIAGALVVLEQPDSNGIDRIAASTTSAADGSFSFGGLVEGTFDIVAAAAVTSAGSPVTYAATASFGVPTGVNVGSIPLEPEYGYSNPAGPPAQVNSTANSSGTLGVPVPLDIRVSVLELAPSGHPAAKVTLPLFVGSTSPFSTTASPSCPSGTACANYTVNFPSGYLSYGTFSASGTQYTVVKQVPLEVLLTIEGKAFVHGSANAADCVPATLSEFPVVVDGTLASVDPKFSFTGCS